MSGKRSAIGEAEAKRASAREKADRQPVEPQNTSAREATMPVEPQKPRGRQPLDMLFHLTRGQEDARAMLPLFLSGGLTLEQLTRRWARESGQPRSLAFADAVVGLAVLRPFVREVGREYGLLARWRRAVERLAAGKVPPSHHQIATETETEGESK